MDHGRYQLCWLKGNGESWCNGDCVWINGQCQSGDPMSYCSKRQVHNMLLQNVEDKFICFGFNNGGILTKCYLTAKNNWPAQWIQTHRRVKTLWIFSHFIVKSILIPLLIDCHQGQKTKDWSWWARDYWWSALQKDSTLSVKIIFSLSSPIALCLISFQFHLIFT